MPRCQRRADAIKRSEDRLSLAPAGCFPVLHILPPENQDFERMSEKDIYDNPLITRYASREMAELWGPQRKFGTWRRLWLVLAEAEHEVGLLADDGVTPRIRPQQLAELRAHLEDIDFARAKALEQQLRHDVMAHIHVYGEACPGARDILHLGATSCYVTDNTDLILMRDGLQLLRDRLVGVVDALARFAAAWADLPTLGFTHFQPAQLTTVGKRACLWCYDFVLDLREIEGRLQNLRFRGVKGTTGTQASFLALFGGDHEKVRRLEQLVAHKMGFNQVYPVTGQTYTRKVDSQIIDTLSGVCQSAHKFGTDLRLLAHLQEIEEPFESAQIGSSAMAYKRNPMRAERMCSLARFISSLAPGMVQTAATQWLERTLDDSAIRRLSLPQAFLGADGVLRLALNITNGLVVNRHVIARNVDEALPYMATETLLMAAVARGADRQAAHERIRVHSRAVADQIKAGERANNLLERLRSDPVFRGIDFDVLLQRSNFVGRAPEQVAEFIEQEIVPIRARYRHLLDQRAEVAV
jgi:adenylosuccinate lyase